MSEDVDAVPGPILVVDDDVAVRDSLAWLLESEGYAVVTAANGKEALARLGAGRLPRLVLLDLTMPVMDGPSCVAALLQDDALRCIPVVMMTDCMRPVPPGVASVLPKPFEPEQLFAEVARFCGR